MYLKDIYEGGMGMTVGTLIVGAVLVAVIAAVVASMVRDKKSGKSLQCGGDCSKCKGGCR